MSAERGREVAEGFCGVLQVGGPTRKVLMRRSLALMSILVLLGCGGGSSRGSGGGGGTSGSETPVVAGEDDGFEDDGFVQADPSVDHGSQSAHELIGVHAPAVPFDRMSRADQEMYMVGTFLPIQAESFRAYSEERFQQFECVNCHGEDAAAVNYAMPSRALPPLPAPGTPRWEQMAQGPAYTFMHEVVVPETATLLGEQPYSAETPNGFGCFGCHPHAGS